MTCYTTLALYLLSVLASLAHVDAAVIPLRRVQLQSHRPAMVVERLPLAARDGAAPVIVTVTTTTTAVVTVPATPTATEASSSTSSSSSSSSSSSTTESSSSTTSSTTNPASTSTSTPTTLSSTSSSSSSTTTTQDPPKQTDPPADGSKKLVVAHHMVGNTFPYKKQDWLDDIVLAHESGIDGFSLNTGKDAWEPARIADAYQAALESKLDFKLFISLDMTSIPCASADDGAFIRKLVLDHASHPNQLKYTSTGAAGGEGDRAFVSTFAGENCKFGNGGASAPDAWRGAFTQHPDVKGKVYFVPSFFIDPATFKTFAGVMDGDFNWNSGWPIKVTTGFAKDLLTNVLNKFKEAAQRTSTNKPAPAAGGGIGGILNKPISQILTAATPEDGSKDFQVELGKFIGSTESDTEHLDALKGLGQAALQKRDGEGEGEGKPVYMAAVSPWFFTHYGADSFNKNFIFLADQHLYTKRWESIVDSRDKLDIVQILTWNDYGESHYVGPIKGDQPNSEAWTDGMSHTGWLQMTKYYATAFKTGKFPEIEKDQIYMWSRPHPVNAQAPDPVPQPTNFELSEDSVWVVVMATAPGTLKLSTGNGQDKSMDIPKGVSKQSIPISAGGTMKGTIERDGKTVLELAPTKEEFMFQGSPKTYNFNAFVASAVAK
ncbi:hypothetical protein D9611_007495 [Ephemerocybe angulata]|uniref:Glycoside hydrolase family 71 protein n=1 Tax=Ephemerocybe angulata TaxID=980116 RepID=A0A8H5CFF0_9AGAR|nr:hypothetical protein D9611_007495 [Tulosesus angulatus]